VLDNEVFAVAFKVKAEGRTPVPPGREVKSEGKNPAPHFDLDN
jgi:hypothetical protein